MLELIDKGGKTVAAEGDGFWSSFWFEIASAEDGRECVGAGEDISGVGIRFEFLQCKQV